MKFTIECEMKDRWIPHFLGMLKRMEQLGGQGSSRLVSIYSDGDGDFHPKFIWDNKLSIAEPLEINKNGDWMFDAG